MCVCVCAGGFVPQSAVSGSQRHLLHVPWLLSGPRGCYRPADPPSAEHSVVLGPQHSWLMLYGCCAVRSPWRKEHTLSRICVLCSVALECVS